MIVSYRTIGNKLPKKRVIFYYPAGARVTKYLIIKF